MLSKLFYLFPIVHCDVAEPWQLAFKNYSSLANNGIILYYPETDKVRLLKENKSRAGISGHI